MKRTHYIEIAGKNYPIRFGIGATKKLTERCGDVSKIADSLLKDGSAAEQIDTVVWFLEILINSGCAYKNMFEKDIPAEENDPVVDGKWIPLTAEEIEIGLDITEINKIKAAIMTCLSDDSKKTIEGEEIEVNNRKKEKAE